MIQSEDILWQGPFSWPGFERINALETIPDTAGVYVWTFEYHDGYILRSAGVTNSMKRRFSHHTRAYLSGKYTVLDVSSAQHGERKELWHDLQCDHDGVTRSRMNAETMIPAEKSQLCM